MSLVWPQPLHDLAGLRLDVDREESVEQPMAPIADNVEPRGSADTRRP